MSSDDSEAVDSDIPTVQELAKTVEDLQRVVSENNEAAAALRTLFREVGIDPVEYDTLFEGAHVLAERFNELEEIAESANAKASLEANEHRRKGSKVEIAKRLSRNIVAREAIRRGKGSVDYNTLDKTVSEHVSGGIEARTAFDAWDDLVDEYPTAFSVKGGQPGPNTPNKRLVTTEENLPAEIKAAVTDDSNGGG